jgi:hypothetical protein
MGLLYLFRYAYIYITGDINRRGDVFVDGLKACEEVGKKIHTFLISALRADKWKVSSLSRLAPGFH